MEPGRIKSAIGGWLAVWTAALLGAACLEADAAVLTVTNASDSGLGTLRSAIDDANVQADLDTIEFNIPGPGPHTISVTEALPTITTPLVINGYSQPGASSNTLAVGNSAAIQIRLVNGASVNSGLRIQSAGCAVYGLAILNFSGDGIYLSGSANTLIQGNLIGLDVDGVTVEGNSGWGIRSTAGGAVIGGGLPWQRNVVSGNLGGGISLQSSPSNVIQGNYIGTDASGTLPRGNQGMGVELIQPNSQFNVIGGALPEERNVISAATGTSSNNHGIYLFNATGNRIAGNYIGTDVTGTNGLGNMGAGVYMTNAAMNNVVGGIDPGAGNTLAFNALAGVWIASGTNAVLGNSMFANGGLGIDLGTAGPTLIDIGDTDSGPNDLQNYPVLTGVTNAYGFTAIHGVLQSRPSTDYRIEFFASPSRDPSGYGEGKIFLGSTNVTTDVSGMATIAAHFATGSLRGQVLAATATGPANTSSEFSLAPWVIFAEPPAITEPPQDVFITEFGGSAQMAVGADGTGPLRYQWYKDGNALPGQTNSTLAFGNVQASDLGLYSVTVSNPFGEVGPLSASVGVASGAGIWIVNSTEDSGPGSLRQAILDANASLASGTLYFNYAGAGPHTIQLESALPSLTQPTVLDATLLPGYLGQPLVELDGGGLLGDGLVLVGGGSVVRGLSIVNFAGSGIRLEQRGTNVVEANYIGLRPDGLTAAGNGQHGILVMASVGNRIGGLTEASRNVISANLGEGVRLDSLWTSNNVIQGNFIGTDASGTLGRGNGGSGVQNSDATGNTVGGKEPGAGNWIAGNGRAGVLVLSGQCRIMGNTIAGNTDIGIDLGGNGSTPNDSGDFDNGPNRLLNHPELFSVNNGPEGTSLLGWLQSVPNSTYHIEVFAGTECGGAEFFLGSLDATTDSFGEAVFSELFITGDLSGWFLTATATDQDGNTSELAPCRRASVPPYIVNQPENETAREGESVSIFVQANGTPPLAYQWHHDGSPILGATNEALSFLGVTGAQAGSYHVVVSNLDGVAISDSATLTVLVPTLPLLTAQPQSQTVPPGSSVLLSVSFSGVGPFAVQWRLNGVNLPGATNATLALDNLQPTDSGTYSAVVWTSAGAVDSAPATLTVTLPSLAMGDSFSGQAMINTQSGSGRASNASATREPGEPVHADKPGEQSVWITWKAPKTGIATFTTAGSTFDTLLAIYKGNVLTNLTLMASDDDAGGFHTSALKFNAVSGTQYKIAVDGFGGAGGDVVLNWNLEQTSQALPLIATHPESQTVAPGEAVTFAVSTTGTGLSYQWFFNGLPIPGATTPSLPLEATSEANVGEYFVRVSNASRSLDSARVRLELNSVLAEPGDAPIRSANKFFDGFSTALKP